MRLRDQPIIFDALRRGLIIMVAGRRLKLSEMGSMTVHEFIKICDAGTTEEVMTICTQIQEDIDKKKQQKGE